MRTEGERIGSILVPKAIDKKKDYAFTYLCSFAGSWQLAFLNSFGVYSCRSLRISEISDRVWFGNHSGALT
ncbi:MAG: hypothetical protein BRC55_13270 [Cyanobacteria bacterium SW_8_48_13]|nr:MAG: hypothetical protein BRC55_13270 [Cyanobacteria bacterium SW_8_48_13]